MLIQRFHKFSKIVFKKKRPNGSLHGRLQGLHKWRGLHKWGRKVGEMSEKKER